MVPRHSIQLFESLVSCDLQRGVRASENIIFFSPHECIAGVTVIFDR